jgi:hypothetical protein
MNWNTYLAAAAVVVMAGAAQPAFAQSGGVAAGTLTCNADSGWGLILGSTTDLKCTYTSAGGRTESYTGKITKLGIDIGYHGAGVMVWAVLAPTADPAKGVLSGTYVGVTGGAHVGVGASGNLLIGGSDKTVTLQPLSIEGATGLNVAAGLAGLSLTAS